MKELEEYKIATVELARANAIQLEARARYERALTALNDAIIREKKEE